MKARPDIVQDEHLDYLDDLQSSGAINMFGGAPHIANKFFLAMKDARTIHQYWMDSYAERHLPQESL